MMYYVINSIEYEDYRTKFFQVDYKCSERQRHAITRANPERRLIDRLLEDEREREGEEENQEEGGHEKEIQD